MKFETVQDIFEDVLADMRSCEQQLIKDGLPAMIKAATSRDLAEAFTMHLQETEGQLARIDRIADILGIDLKTEKCEATEGLISEASDLIKHTEKGPVLDVAIIVAAQKIEHYEISGYGSLRTLAEKLGYDEAAKIIQETLNEEKAADTKLNKLALDHLDYDGLMHRAAA